jgi:hypothetical protein
MKDSFDPECGCPVRECVIWPCDVDLHINPDGTGDIVLDTGDWQEEIINTFATSLDELYQIAEKIVNEKYNSSEVAYDH